MLSFIEDHVKCNILYLQWNFKSLFVLPKMRKKKRLLSVHSFDFETDSEYSSQSRRQSVQLSPCPGKEDFQVLGIWWWCDDPFFFFQFLFYSLNFVSLMCSLRVFNVRNIFRLRLLKIYEMPGALCFFQKKSKCSMYSAVWVSQQKLYLCSTSWNLISSTGQKTFLDSFMMRT